MNIRCIVFQSALFLIVHGQAFNKYNYPTILTDKQGCGRPNDTYQAVVCDPAQKLPEDKLTNLDRAIKELRDSKECICGVYCDQGPFPYSFIKIGIAIIPELEGGQDTTDERRVTVRQFARHLREVSWNFGECGDDIVIALAVKERHVQTSIGHKVEEIMSSTCVDNIFQQQKEYFSDGQYYEGLQALVEEYTNVLKSGDASSCNGQQPWWVWVLVALGGGGLLAGCVACCCCCGCCRGGGGGGSSSHHHGWGYGGDSGGGGGWGGGGDSGGGGGGGDF